MPVKLSHRGVAWNGAWTGVGDRNVEPDGMGGELHDGLDKIGRVGVCSAGKPPLEDPAWIPLDGPASGFKVGGRREAQGAAMI